MKHTQGPWYAGEWGTVYGPTGCGQVAGISPRVTEEETIANLRLIVAAPELLASLIEVFQDKQSVNNLSWIDKASAAIAKATGGEE